MFEERPYLHVEVAGHQGTERLPKALRCCLWPARTAWLARLPDHVEGLTQCWGLGSCRSRAQVLAGRVSSDRAVPEEDEPARKGMCIEQVEVEAHPGWQPGFSTAHNQRDRENLKFID